MRPRGRTESVVPTMLDLAYSAAVPRELLAQMERAAKRMGLPLATLEEIGQSEARCRAFVHAARVGHRRAAELALAPAQRPAWVLRRLVRP